jgi:hypothetical protein
MLVKLDELDQSWGFRTLESSGAADAERMKLKAVIRRHERPA